MLGKEVLQTPPELDRVHLTFAAKPRQGDCVLPSASNQGAGDLGSPKTEKRPQMQRSGTHLRGLLPRGFGTACNLNTPKRSTDLGYQERLVNR